MDCAAELLREASKTQSCVLGVWEGASGPAPSSGRAHTRALVESLCGVCLQAVASQQQRGLPVRLTSSGKGPGTAGPLGLRCACWPAPTVESQRAGSQRGCQPGPALPLRPQGL